MKLFLYKLFKILEPHVIITTVKTLLLIRKRRMAKKQSVNYLEQAIVQLKLYLVNVVLDDDKKYIIERLFENQHLEHLYPKDDKTNIQPK